VNVLIVSVAQTALFVRSVLIVTIVTIALVAWGAKSVRIVLVAADLWVKLVGSTIRGRNELHRGYWL
jgi:hypothetical protein